MNFFSALHDTIQYQRDKRRVGQLYEQCMGRSVNWDHPTRFTEKIQLFKISKTAEDYWKYTDKLEVRKYVEKQIGPQYLTKLYGVYNTPDEIDFDALPKAFVLKTTHGSGWNILCPDKSKLDIAEAKKKLAGWLSQNFYQSYGWERQYKKIKPRILCEEYLETRDKGLFDFKFYCFHGEPHFINVVHDRSGPTGKAFYELPWKKSQMQPWEAKADLDIPEPENLEAMLDLSRKLSQPFEQVRVDLYEVKGRILFGELTFTCCAGLRKFVPDHFDELFGSYW